MEDSMSNKHLPRLFAQALNEKRVELFDEFIHPEYNNHNAYVEAGPAGVKAFFRQYLDAFPDTKVVMDDAIEEGDRISARFTYNGTFSKAFMGYRPNGAPVQMRSIDIWRVKDGKFVEHCDELNLLEVFQQIGAATVRKQEGHSGRRVLAFGKHPEIAQEQLRSLGLQAIVFALTNDEAGEARLVAELKRDEYDGVIIGAYINGQDPVNIPPRKKPLPGSIAFSTVHANAPNSKVILARAPEDIVPAI
jgi:predicted SnoaL-like aldol condensation-catalyzing enzyme